MDNREEPRQVIDLARARRFTVRQVLTAVGMAALLLLLIEGPSIRDAGEEMDRGVVRTLVLAVGKPAGAVGDQLPFHDAADDATAFLDPDDDLGGEGGFERAAAPDGSAGGDTVPPVTPDAFDPGAIGAKVRKRPLKKVLITGDSLSQPLDAELARRLADRGVQAVRDAHVGTGISKTDLLDWGKLSVRQVAKDEPDAIVMFIGANEGFPLPAPDGGDDLICCGADWTAEYAFRVRTMMNTYRQEGRARLYWLTLPAPRAKNRQEVARSVNAGIWAAAAPYRAQVRVIDTIPVFTPGFRYRAAMDVGGRETIVRESDGIHLNEDGARVAADVVEQALARDFTTG
jgi:lysophospholipase L1-like esterase